MKKTLILLTGRSGSGKTTVSEYCKSIYNMNILQSYTTRPPRYEGETGHIFITEDEFQRVPKDQIAAFVEYNGYKYFSTKEQLDKNDIYIIDPKTAVELKKGYAGEKDVKIVTLDTPVNTCIYNMLARLDKKSAVAKRTFTDLAVFKNAKATADIVIPYDSVSVMGTMLYLISIGLID